MDDEPKLPVAATKTYSLEKKPVKVLRIVSIALGWSGAAIGVHACQKYGLNPWFGAGAGGLVGGLTLPIGKGIKGIIELELERGKKRREEKRQIAEYRKIQAKEEQESKERYAKLRTPPEILTEIILKKIPIRVGAYKGNSEEYRAYTYVQPYEREEMEIDWRISHYRSPKYITSLEVYVNNINELLDLRRTLHHRALDDLKPDAFLPTVISESIDDLIERRELAKQEIQYPMNSQITIENLDLYL